MLAEESTCMFGLYHYPNAYICSESPKSREIILNAWFERQPTAVTSLWARVSSTIATGSFLAETCTAFKTNCSL